MHNSFKVLLHKSTAQRPRKKAHAIKGFQEQPRTLRAGPPLPLPLSPERRGEQQIPLSPRGERETGEGAVMGRRHKA
jgi:hypothetical protein